MYRKVILAFEDLYLMVKRTTEHKSVNKRDCRNDFIRPQIIFENSTPELLAMNVGVRLKILRVY